MREPTSGPVVVSLALILGCVAVTGVQAQGRGHAGSGHAPAHIDGRFGHGHSYYDHGIAPRGSPRGAYTVHHGGANLSYDRNHWYRRDSGRTTIIGAPFGALVPFLPWYYSTLWWDGEPYYYANDTYYTWNADQHQYQVVAPPVDIESGAKLAPAIGDLFVYPMNGQTDDQKMSDEAGCHLAAVKEIGFDPTLSDDGLSTEAAEKRGLYRRSLSACLMSRGYRVE
jgi:hypothetical protein